MPSPELSEPEENALKAISKVERILFGGSVRYVCGLCHAQGNRIASFAKKNGFAASCQLFIAMQLGLIGAAVLWTGVLANTINVSLGTSDEFVVGAMVLLFVVGGLGFLWSLWDINKASRLGRRYQASGSPDEDLPAPATSPRPTPVISTIALSVLGLNVIGIGACLLAAKYVAPRVTGVFFVILGGLLLALSLRPLLKRALPGGA